MTLTIPSDWTEPNSEVIALSCRLGMGTPCTGVRLLSVDPREVRLGAVVLVTKTKSYGGDQQQTLTWRNAELVLTWDVGSAMRQGRTVGELERAHK